jgi:hypothetical protein
MNFWTADCAVLGKIDLHDWSRKKALAGRPKRVRLREVGENQIERVRRNSNTAVANAGAKIGRA